jgi:hypothetical protein
MATCPLNPLPQPDGASTLHLVSIEDDLVQRCLEMPNFTLSTHSNNHRFQGSARPEVQGRARPYLADSPSRVQLLSVTRSAGYVARPSATAWTTSWAGNAQRPRGTFTWKVTTALPASCVGTSDHAPIGAPRLGIARRTPPSKPSLPALHLSPPPDVGGVCGDVVCCLGGRLAGGLGEAAGLALSRSRQRAPRAPPSPPSPPSPLVATGE